MGAIVRYNNLTGGLNTVQGINTINQSVKRTESPEMQNIEYYKLGGIQSMQGNTLFGTQFDTNITLGYEYIYGNEKYMIICTADGKVWIYNKLTNSFDLIYTFPTPTERHSICSFNNGIVISNGIDDLVYYQYGRNDLLDGSVTLTDGSKEVVGTGTNFTTQLGVGDYLSFEGLSDDYKVTAITDDTHLTVDKEIPVEAEQPYYAFTNGNTTYYTTSLDNSINKPIYTISGETVTQVDLSANLQNNVLTTTEKVVQTVQGTRYDAWSQPTLTSNNSWGTISDYTITTNVGIRNSPNSYTWNFPTTLQLNSFSFTYSTMLCTITLIISDSTGKQLTSVNLPANVFEQNMTLSIPKTTANGIKIMLNIYPTSYGAGLEFATAYQLANFRMYGTQAVPYNYEQVVTTNVTYNRNSALDTSLAVILSDVKYYLTDISELNAVYTNEDDPNISKPVRGLALQSYQGRIFVGANDGILYYSEVGLIHGWDLKYGAGAIPTFYDDNSDFTALGLFDKYLVICKRERSYLLDGIDTNDANWTINPYSDYTCDSQQSWLVANNSFLVYSRTAGGIYPLLQRTIYNPNYQGVELSTKIRDSFNSISRSRFDYIFPVYSPKKKYIMFYIPMSSGNGSNYCFIFDLQTKTWLLRVVPQNVTCAFRYDNEIYITTQDGCVLKEFTGTTFNGEAIEWFWKSPWFSFGDGSNYLSTREFRINLSEEGANNFKVRTRRDGIDTYKTRTINGDTNNFVGLEWEATEDNDSLTDTVWDENSWTVTKHTIKRFPLPNQYFQTIQVEFYGRSLQEAISIYGFEFHGIQLEEATW